LRPAALTYVATAEVGDEEMKSYRERRGARWRTIEAPR
jgi:adenosyl cobinamide kinase/adenosyl cobinamide phosphate guanylyltransferase